VLYFITFHSAHTLPLVERRDQSERVTFTLLARKNRPQNASGREILKTLKRIRIKFVEVKNILVLKSQLKVQATQKNANFAFAEKKQGSKFEAIASRL